MSGFENFQARPDVLARMQLEMQRAEAKEYRRQLMQGLGNRIISLESNGFRLVAVGSEIRWSKVWRTFHDFLLTYIKDVFTPAWGTEELKKPDGACHPLIAWQRKIQAFHQTRVAETAGKIRTDKMTGAMKAYLGLAYDLYLCAHNAVLPELLLKRLRNPATFEGALYEAFVIGCFSKAGFAIEMEDEGDSDRSHCEFVATHKITGKRFSVEAKAVTSASRRAGASAERPRVRDKLHAALKKDAPHSRIIFIELSRTQTLGENGEPDWAEAVREEIALAETELTINGQPAPPAYLIVTNRAFIHALDSEACDEGLTAYGFKLSEFLPRQGFPSILEAARARDRHIEAHWLLKALQSHREIPSTFDDRTPEEAFGEGPPTSFQIGQIYPLRDNAGREVAGVLCEGTVSEGARTMTGVYSLPDGGLMIYSVPLSDMELASYRRSPDTFFGVVRTVPRAVRTPMDAFDFFFEDCSKLSRESLLKHMASWPKFEALKELSQKELAEIYSAEMATTLWARLKLRG